MIDRDWPEELVERLAEGYGDWLDPDQDDPVRRYAGVARWWISRIASDPDVLKALLGEPAGQIEVRDEAGNVVGHTPFYTLPEQRDE